MLRIKNIGLVLISLTFLSAIVQAQLPKLIPYRVGNKWGFCDSNKKVIVRALYEGAYFAQTGYNAFAVASGYKFQFNSKGTIVKKTKEEPILSIDGEELKIGKQDKYYSDESKESLSKNTINRWWLRNDVGLVDTVTIRNLQYKTYEVENKYGLRCGETIIYSPEYESIFILDTVFVLVKNDKFHLGYSNGKIVNHEYDEISSQIMYSRYMVAKKSNKKGVIDISGIEIVPLKYDDVYTMFFEDLPFGIFEVVKNGKKCFVDYRGVEYCKD